MGHKRDRKFLSRGWLGMASVFVFLLFIPSQLGRHFWLRESYVSGIRVDYLSPTLYFLDLIWIVLFLGEIFRKHFRRASSARDTSGVRGRWFLVLGAVVIINIFLAQRGWIAVYRWARWGQWLLTVEIIRRERKTVWGLLEWCIPLWILTEVGLGWGQILKSSSVGGVWWWLGERSFSLIGSGIARVSVSGVEFLRAYGSFSHPNSLAGFLLVSLFLWWNFKKKGKSKTKKFWWWMVWWVGIIGLVITASRVVWLVGGGVLIWEVIKRKAKGWKGMVGLGMIGVGLGMIVTGVFSSIGGWDLLSVEKRMALIKIGVDMFRDSPLFGVGLGNMVGVLPEYWGAEPVIKGWLQPIHNAYLLVLAEIGIFGFLVWGWLVKEKLFRRKRKTIKRAVLMSLLVISLTGFFDHYWITLPQNWWLMGVVIGLAE